MPDRQLILVIDDSKDDILLIQKSFERANVGHSTHCVRSVAEAKTYLKGELLYSNSASDLIATSRPALRSR